MENSIEKPKEEQRLKTAIGVLCREVVDKERRGLLYSGVSPNWLEVAKELAKNPDDRDTLLFRWKKDLGEGEVAEGLLRKSG